MTAPTQLQHPWPYLSSVFRIKSALRACIGDEEFEQQLPYKLLLSYQCVEVCVCLYMLNLKSTIFVLMFVGS